MEKVCRNFVSRESTCFCSSVITMSGWLVCDNWQKDQWILQSMRNVHQEVCSLTSNRNIHQLSVTGLCGEFEIVTGQLPGGSCHRVISGGKCNWKVTTSESDLSPDLTFRQRNLKFPTTGSSAVTNVYLGCILCLFVFPLVSLICMSTERDFDFAIMPL